MSQSVRHHLILLLVAGLSLFSNLGGPRLWDRDEPRNAGCTVEMLAAHDWVTPLFNGEYRTHKPILQYWLMMTSYGLFGVNEFAARFWSALLGAGGVLAVYHLGRRLFHPRVGLLAGLILATTFMFDVASRAATPDYLLIFLSSMALTVYALGVFPKKENSANAAQGGDTPTTEPTDRYFLRSFPRAVAVYAIMGLAVLAKGPVGLVLPTAVLGMFLLIVSLPKQTQAPTTLAARLWALLRPFHARHFIRTCWKMRPLTALATVALIAAPWYVWVGLRTDGQWLTEFFWTHNIARATSSMEGHAGSLFYYPVAILAGFFPWSVFAGPVLLDLITRMRKSAQPDPAYIFLTCWVGVYVGLFSFAQTKLPSYVTPCFPALALLVGCFLHHWREHTEYVAQFWPRLSLASLVLVGLVFLIGLPLAARQFLPGEEWLGLIGLIPLATGVGCLYLVKHNLREQAVLWFAGSAVCLTTSVFAIAAARVDSHQQSHVLLEEVGRRSEQPHVAAFGVLEPSWVFYLGRPVQEFSGQEPQAAAAFFEQYPDAFIIAPANDWRTLKPYLPVDSEVLAEAPYFMKNRSLVLIGRAERMSASKVSTTSTR